MCSAIKLAKITCGIFFCSTISKHKIVSRFNWFNFNYKWMSPHYPCEQLQYSNNLSAYSQNRVMGMNSCTFLVHVIITMAALLHFINDSSASFSWTMRINSLLFFFVSFRYNFMHLIFNDKIRFDKISYFG